MRAFYSGWISEMLSGSPSKPRAYFEATKERNLAIIALLFGSGVRVSELVNMNLEDLNMDRHCCCRWCVKVIFRIALTLLTGLILI